MKINIKRFLSNAIIYTMIEFMYSILLYTSIILFVFQIDNFHFSYILLFLGVSLIFGILFSLFIQINNITLFFQLAIIYISNLTLGYLLCYFTNLYSSKSLVFFIISLFVGLLGLVLSTIVFLIKKNKVTKELNDDLQKYLEKVK